MTDLAPDTGDKLGKLLPRLASDAPGEVLATVAAIRRTLDRGGLDLHDLAARLTEAPKPVYVAKRPPQPATLSQMAGWLRFNARDRLTGNQFEFVVKASGLLASGRKLTAKQEKWLRDLHAMHKGH